MVFVYHPLLGYYKARKVYCSHCGKEIYIIIISDKKELRFKCLYCGKENYVVFTKYGYCIKGW